MFIEYVICDFCGGFAETIDDQVPPKDWGYVSIKIPPTHYTYTFETEELHACSICFTPARKKSSERLTKKRYEMREGKHRMDGDLWTKKYGKGSVK